MSTDGSPQTEWRSKLARYNVAWDSPSENANGSMPLGNGDLALNVWVEPNGDLLLLIAKSDAWDESSILLKLGRVRMKMTPNLLAGATTFLQTLDLATATITIDATGPAGAASVRVWVDANHPTASINVANSVPTTIEASVEHWRREPRTIKTQTGDIFKNLTGKDLYPTEITPDHILPHSNDRLWWCHHNERRDDDGYEINMRLQGLDGMLDQMPHPLRGRTFGASLGGDGFDAIDDTTLRSTATTKHQLSLSALTQHPSTIEQWRDALERIAATPVDRVAHEQWWAAFWQRSWLYVESTSPDETERRAAFEVSRGYVLQRFMNACAGRGASPIKFNGSLFSVGKPDDPDFRRWGGPGFWFMNSRLVYWPMFAMGDFDLLQPWLTMLIDQLPLQNHRTRVYFGHDGAHYPETSMFWGAEVSGHYGWTPFDERPRPEAECAYLTYYWSGGIELSLILLTHLQYTGDDAFARTGLVPIADAVTTFYDLHYPRDEHGQLRFEPAQSLETWHFAINPMPEIAGLRYLLPLLLDLPEHLTTVDMRARWRRMIDELPPLPVGEVDGQRRLLPADQFDRLKNTENPELYCIFPYRLFGLNKPDLQLAQDTFAARRIKLHECWSQDEIQMALLGLSDDVKAYISARASDATHKESRFPAFWDSFHDWLPDMDHGGVLQLALQYMLMQCDGDSIALLPAWPKDWDADFRLHGPKQTMVTGKVHGAKLESLQVSPESRRQDVTSM